MDYFSCVLLLENIKINWFGSKPRIVNNFYFAYSCIIELYRLRYELYGRYLCIVVTGGQKVMAITSNALKVTSLK